VTRDQLDTRAAPGPYRAPKPSATLAPGSKPEPRRLATFPRTETEELRVELAEYEGKPFLNLRIWFRSTDGAWLPTKKGVTIRMREISDLVAALGEVRRP